MAHYNAPVIHVDPVESQIHQFIDHMIDRLNQRRVELVNSYRETKNEMAARPLARARKEEELVGLKADTERRLQMNELRDTQLRVLAELERTLAEVRTPQPETRAVFRSDSIHLEEAISGVGKIVEEEVPVVPRYELMRPVVAVGKKGRAPGELRNPNGVAIDVNTGFIYVAEGLGSCRISIFSETGDFLNTFKHQDMEWPCRIAIHRDNLYLTDIGVHALFHFKFEAGLHLVATFGNGKGSADEQFNFPRGLTVSNNGDLFITDCNNHRIKILDSSLHVKTHITHQSMRKPRDVKLTQDEVYVLCEISPCILVFSHAGEMKRSLVTRGNGMQVINPFFFCLDANQNLLITDWEDDKLKIFSKDGTLLHAIGQQGHGVGMFDWPKGIVLTKNLNLVIVSGNINYRLQIFSCN